MNILKIFSIAKRIMPKDVINTTNKLTGAIKSGYKTSKRCNSIYNKSGIAKVGTTTKSVTKELGKLKFSRDEMPALAASLVTLIPIPSPIPITPIIYGAGHGINQGLKITSKFLDKVL